MKKLLMLTGILSLTILASAHAGTLTCKKVTLSAPVPGYTFSSVQLKNDEDGGYSFTANVNDHGLARSYTAKIDSAYGAMLLKVPHEIFSTGLCKNRGSIQYMIYEYYNGVGICLQDCAK